MRLICVLTIALVTLVGLLLPSPASAAESIYVRNGPDGEVRISTPWGDYAAYDEGGGLYWVGTQREFDRARVIGIMREHGARVSTLKLSRDSTAEFVERDSFRARIGSDIAIDEIVPEIAFDDPVSGHSPATYHTLDVLWIQGSNVVVSCLVYDPKKHYIYANPQGEDANGEWRDVVIGLPNDLFKRPMALIFLAPNRKPAVIGIASLTRWDYKYVKGRLTEQYSEHDSKQLLRLVKFDPTLH